MKSAIKRSLQDEVLRSALERALGHLERKRHQVFADIDVENLRDEARRIREEAIENLDGNLKILERNVKERGGKFFFAKDAEAANRYIIQLASHNKVKKIVKAKSMTCEEIRLNEALEEAGIEVVETDLGEWIVQLSGEKPSHITAPAMHKTKEEIAKLLSEKLGVKLPPDPVKLTKMARKTLREKYFEAEMGISGVNFAVADRGTIILVTNEGNARLVTSIPKVHVAVMGMEKVIPKLENSIALLKLLPRNATAQKLTSYVSFISPSDKFHLVVVDNGRSKMLEDEDFKEALYCIRCGGCMNFCPVFREIGGHIYSGRVYQGAMGVLWSAFVDGKGARANASKIAALCTACEKCAQVCPVRIDLPWKIAKVKSPDKLKGLAYRTFLPRRELLGLGLTTLGVVRKLGLLKPARWALGTVSKDLADVIGVLEPLEVKKPLWKRVAKKAKTNAVKVIKHPSPRYKVGYFLGCGTGFLFPDAGEATLKVLHDLDCEIYIPRHPCCGMPAFYHGDEGLAEGLARRNIKAFEINVDFIISDEASCSAFLKSYPKLLGGQASEFSEKIKELSEFLYEVGIDQILKPINASVTCHASCHLIHQGIDKKQRLLIQSIPRIEFKEQEKADLCCGGAGTYWITQHGISMRMLERKMKSLSKVDADVLIVPCSGCKLQLSWGIKKEGLGMEVFHLQEVLAKAFKQR
jgi:iron-sulfur cluster protein